MAIETYGDGGMCITGEHIQVYTLLSMRSALSLEVKTGMKFSNRVNVANQVRAVLQANNYVAPRKKTALLAMYEMFLRKAGILKE